MLKLDSTITLNKETIESPNLTDKFSEDDLKRIGEWVFEGYQQDKRSRAKWETRTNAAMDLAMQIQKSKTFPWADCSNVAFPLVTIAVLQFYARAYAGVLDGANVVKYRVIGPDPSGQARQRGDRIGTHMSWQLLEQDEDWEPQHGRTLIHYATVGTAFKKSYYSGEERCNESDLVMAKDLVLNYWSTSVECAQRKTQIIPMFRNDIYSRVQRKIFRNILEEPWYQAPPPVQQTHQQLKSDNRAGVSPPSLGDETTPFNMLEQHCCLDLDGDGYAEPYIITIEENQKCPVRIVTRFDREEDIERTESGEIIQIRAQEYFTRYEFLPSPDGGIYGIGFGVLLGPLNESTNSLINQLIDAGTMATTAGGFLGRGAKIRGGVYTFAPLEWKRVDSTGDDLHKSIVPLPVREPSAVLFQLLSLLVNYTQRISGSTDMMVGENPGQNTPAETSRTMIEQGSKIYNSIFKGCWYSMKEEFKKLYILNGIHLPEDTQFGADQKSISRADYLGNPSGIAPVADPNITSEAMRMQQIQMVKASAMQTRGYNMDEVEMRLLKALKVDAPEQLFPGTKGQPPQPDVKLQIAQLEQQTRQAELQQENVHFAAELMEEQRMNNAKIVDLQGKLSLAAADMKGDEADREIGRINAMIGIMKTHNDALEGRIKLMLDRIKLDNERRKLDASKSDT